MPLIVQHARHLSYIVTLSSVRLSVGKDLLLRRTPTPGLGTTWGVVPTGSQPTGILTLLFTMDNLDYLFTTHGSCSVWGHRNLSAYWAGIPANGSGPCPGGKPSTLCDNCNIDACLMTSNLNVLDQYVLCLQGTASKLLELIVGHVLGQFS